MIGSLFLGGPYGVASVGTVYFEFFDSDCKTLEGEQWEYRAWSVHGERLGVGFGKGRGVRGDRLEEDGVDPSVEGQGRHCPYCDLLEQARAAGGTRLLRGQCKVFS